MAPAASARCPTRRLVTVWLREDFVPSGRARVDRDAGLIRGVKIGGLTSANGRRYTLEAYREALPLYEGAPVFCDHPRKANEQREVDRRLGTLFNIRLGSDGPYGDLKILKSHPIAERLLEAAESMPDAFGLSHNAQGKGESGLDGVFVVHHIVEVRSVDLVAEPATNRSLFESREAVMDPYDPNKPEMEDEMGGDPVATETDPAAAGGGVKAAIREEIMKILDSDADTQSMLSQIREWLKIHEKSQAIGKDPEPVAEMDDEDGDEEETEESRRPPRRAKGTLTLEEQRELGRYRRQEKARQLCEAQGVVNPPRVLLLALGGARDEAEMKTLIREHKAAAPARRTRSHGPSGVALTESRDTDLAKLSDDELVAFLRS